MKNKLQLKPMTVAELKVVRQNEMGAFLDAGTGKTSDDILLHKAQQTAEVSIGEKVKVFLYLDPKKRLTASMRVPKMREGQIARLKIINVTGDGAFVDVGAERGIFMPFAEMRGRPKVGEIVWAKLYSDKSGRLAVSMKVSDEIRRASKPAEGIKRGDKIKGAVFNIIDAGAFVFSEERYIVFIARKEMPRELRIGEVVEARVTFLREDGRLDASLRAIKETALERDAEKIFNFMQKNGGSMNFHDKTAPEKIQAVFKISKAAFKRAVGHLYSQRRIEKIDGGFKII
ncbi:MAG: RNA-binding protein [Selenomonadaceae bacterium]|nr:RNA-binding protein [Selenomonadaceae bacterium]MBQ7723279.1 RNA-binding protein [Selenomonadaceae bacterium]